MGRNFLDGFSVGIADDDGLLEVEDDDESGFVVGLTRFGFKIDFFDEDTFGAAVVTAFAIFFFGAIVGFGFGLNVGLSVGLNVVLNAGGGGDGDGGRLCVNAPSSRLACVRCSSGSIESTSKSDK